MIPRLETERLILRGHTAEDFEPMAAFLADPEVARFIAARPLTREMAWRSLATTIGHWYLRGFGAWAVVSMAYAFLTQPVDRLISCIDKDNVASQKVAARLGETRGPAQQLVAGGEEFEAEIWSITRAEWQRRSAVSQASS